METCQNGMRHLGSGSLCNSNANPCSCSSVGQSAGLWNQRSVVRAHPAVPFLGLRPLPLPKSQTKTPAMVSRRRLYIRPMRALALADAAVAGGARADEVARPVRLLGLGAAEQEVEEARPTAAAIHA